MNGKVDIGYATHEMVHAVIPGVGGLTPSSRATARGTVGEFRQECRIRLV